MDATLSSIYDAVIAGEKATVTAKVKQALADGRAPADILNQALIAPMKEVGDRFERGDLYVPEMLISARAMQSGMALLKPFLMEAGEKAAGKVVLGTVKGDLHDIGKNLVGMMLEGAGFEVIDLGTDVGPEKFAEAVRQHQPEVVGMSALLTTTMKSMVSTIEALEDMGVRERVKIVIGGAPVTEAYAQSIGADGFASDASRAVTLVKKLLAG